MLHYLGISTLFYAMVFNHFYTAHQERTFDDCANSTRKFSMVHLSLCLPLASIATYYTPCVWCLDSLFTRTHYTYEIALMNTTGYFIVDLYIILRNWAKYGRVDGGSLMLVHHIFALITYYQVYLANMGLHVCVLFILNETSTVFLNGIYFYAKRPRVRILCGVGLLLSFFVFRILMLAKINYVFFGNWRAVSHMIPAHLLLTFTLTVLLFSCMNIYWYRKICLGFLKALQK